MHHIGAKVKIFLPFRQHQEQAHQRMLVQAVLASLSSLAALEKITPPSSLDLKSTGRGPSPD